ncbi:unnamed protein product [Meganyctiphanes norvegica]|uniref:Uncharacterized protein n=1 Tax=Meganyctiphanes norvegica TaxID=48144 RepID=A0AAV2R9Z2_MEGNR
MTAKLLLFLAVLKLTSSDPMPEPEPNVNVNVGVNVNDNNNGKGGLSCVFGDTCYPDGCIIEGTCLLLKCCNGHWKCLGNEPRPGCGKCEAHGDPHMVPYESNTVLYSIVQPGNFTLTQPGFSNPELFGVNINFENCSWPSGSVVSCIRSITYYEPGLIITLELPPPDVDILDKCDQSYAYANGPNCSITLWVNGEVRPTPTGCEADSFTGTDGNVLVFKQKHISKALNLYCIAIVGSKGFSMALCQHSGDFPWFYVYAMPSLKKNPSLLYGLCDVWTGTPPIAPMDYTTRSGTTTTNKDVFVTSWEGALPLPKTS